jgi:hypothetical protein
MNTRTRSSSFLDGSPTPEWVEDVKRRTGRQPAAHTLAAASSELAQNGFGIPEPSEPRKPKRDWLAPKPRHWLAVP